MRLKCDRNAIKERKVKDNKGKNTTYILSVCMLDAEHPTQGMPTIFFLFLNEKSASRISFQLTAQLKLMSSLGVRRGFQPCYCCSHGFTNRVSRSETVYFANTKL